LSGRKQRSVKEERRERELALRRDDILTAASQVFADKGFQGAQIAEIANASEVSPNSVYGLFKGKEELYEAVLSSAAKTVGDRVRNAVLDVPDPAEQLLCVIDELFATLWLVDRAREAKKSGNLDGIDAETFALSLIGTVTTTAARWVEDPEEKPMRDAAPRVRALFAQLLGRADA